MNRGLRGMVDYGTLLAATVLSGLMLTAGLGTEFGVSLYFLAVGGVGAATFGPALARVHLKRPLSRRVRGALALVALLVGVLSGSVVVLPVMLVVAIWFMFTATVFAV